MFVLKQENLVTEEEIALLPDYQCVSVRVKIAAEEEEMEVKKGHMKQEYWDCRCYWLYENCDMGGQHWFTRR